MTKTLSTAKWAENYFEDAFNQKKANVFRIPDYSDINFGANSGKQNVAVDPKPADFLITYSKQTFYAEVKTVEKAKAFSFSGIRPAQWKAALKTIRNGGKYYFVIYFKHNAQWYWVPARIILESSKQSLNLEDLEIYKVHKTFM